MMPRFAVAVAFLCATGCGGYWRQPATPQEAWTPTMSEPSKSGATASPDAPVANTTAGRLEELSELHQRGLVTDAEYRKKRQQIIDGL
jgi:hypothetical protein